MQPLERVHVKTAQQSRMILYCYSMPMGYRVLGKNGLWYATDLGFFLSVTGINYYYCLRELTGSTRAQDGACPTLKGPNK